MNNEVNVEDWKPSCPSCGSDRVTVKENYSFLLGIAFGAIGRIFRTDKLKMICSNCDYKGEFVPSEECKKYMKKVNNENGRKLVPIFAVISLVLFILYFLVNRIVNN